jgi:hypothetical protein
MRAGVTTPASTWSPIAVDPFTVCFESLHKLPSTPGSARQEVMAELVRSRACAALHWW